MKFTSIKSLCFTSFFFSFCLVNQVIAQSGCQENSKKGNSCVSTKVTETTSGCSPSACRGAKTKFGEAKVISNLRAELIALKAAMEKSSQPKFAPRAYDIHGIIGETDEESLHIITREVKVVEAAFSDKLNYAPTHFELPSNKAKQVHYLSARIKTLQKLL